MHNSPKHETGVSKYRFLVVISKMLKNEISIRMFFMKHMFHAIQNINPPLVILVPGSNIGSEILCEALAEIISIAINMVFFYPIAVHIINKLLGEPAAVIKIIAHIKWMSGFHIKPD